MSQENTVVGRMRVSMSLIASMTVPRCRMRIVELKVGSVGSVEERGKKGQESSFNWEERMLGQMLQQPDENLGSEKAAAVYTVKSQDRDR